MNKVLIVLIGLFAVVSSATIRSSNKTSWFYMHSPGGVYVEPVEEKNTSVHTSSIYDPSTGKYITFNFDIPSPEIPSTPSVKSANKTKSWFSMYNTGGVYVEPVEEKNNSQYYTSSIYDPSTGTYMTFTYPKPESTPEKPANKTSSWFSMYNPGGVYEAPVEEEESFQPYTSKIFDPTTGTYMTFSVPKY